MIPRDLHSPLRRDELESLACPPVYRQMKDFHHYWAGSKVPRCLTMFVGGNHEAPGHLREMFFGGFAAPDVFYFGSSGVFNVNGLRIAALSGIYKSHDYDKPYFESPPYSENSKRSAYHVRRFDVEKLLLIKEPVDIFVSHDWPSGITDYGDTETMLRLKDRTGQLRSEISSNQLGNPHTMTILKKLKPKFWFAGHMHIKYTAIYTHEDGSITRFLALDKCIPRRPFLQLLRLSTVSGDLLPTRAVNSAAAHPSTPISNQVRLDVEWLGILKANNEAMPVEYCDPSRNTSSFSSKPSRPHLQYPTPAVLEDVRKRLAGCDVVPQFGKIQPGDDKYRKWMCLLLEMRDRIDENSQMIQTFDRPPPVHGAAAARAEENGSSDMLFFED